MECSDCLDGVCATDRLHPCFRKSEVPDLTFLNQVLHRAGHIFDWYVRIDAMLIKQIDAIGLESHQRCIGDLLDVLRPAIHTDLLSVRADLESELGGYDHLIANGSERFAQQFGLPNLNAPQCLGADGGGGGGSTGAAGSGGAAGTSAATGTGMSASNAARSGKCGCALAERPFDRSGEILALLAIAAVVRRRRREVTRGCRN